MSLIKNIFSFFKKIFNKDDNIKKIEEAKETVLAKDKLDFTNSLKVNVEQNKKGQVETRICPGNGLGIQTKFDY